MGQRIKRTVLTAAMLCLVVVALPATARAETSRTSTGLSAAQVKALSRNATQSVIVVFKNQLSTLPANVTFGADAAGGAEGDPVSGRERAAPAPRGPPPLLRPHQRGQRDRVIRRRVPAGSQPRRRRGRSQRHGPHGVQYPRGSGERRSV